MRLMSGYSSLSGSSMSSLPCGSGFGTSGIISLLIPRGYHWVLVVLAVVWHVTSLVVTSVLYGVLLTSRRGDGE